jgi:hypothetical protein
MATPIHGGSCAGRDRKSRRNRLRGNSASFRQAASILERCEEQVRSGLAVLDSQAGAPPLSGLPRHVDFVRLTDPSLLPEGRYPRLDALISLAAPNSMPQDRPSRSHRPPSQEFALLQGEVIDPLRARAIRFRPSAGLVLSRWRCYCYLHSQKANLAKRLLVRSTISSGPIS